MFRSGIHIKIFIIFCLAVLAVTGFARAADFVSMAESMAILYDAPSLMAKKLYVINRYTPLEQVVTLDNWVKVRDISGGLAWVEKRSLSHKRFVVVVTPLAAIRQSPEDKAAVITQVKQQVALEWMEDTGSGWLKVHHLDGATGYIKSTEVWGD